MRNKCRRCGQPPITVNAFGSTISDFCLDCWEDFQNQCLKHPELNILVTDDFCACVDSKTLPAAYKTRLPAAYNNQELTQS